ncbi:MAG: type II toxin-antitoxin system RelE/ParE family toxin [Flavobacteriales bacterium]|nr:type II toxin-antitoxin system RelE/ParE family toxin [Flavobacteriales bacterium]
MAAPRVSSSKSFEVRTIATFDRQLKALAKKHSSLKHDYSKLLDELERDPFQGAALGNACYKRRMAIASKGKGKSGGARVILHIVLRDHLVWLLAIYDKAEIDSIPAAEIKRLLKEIP